MTRGSRLAWIALTLPLVALSACSGDDSPAPRASATTTPERALPPRVQVRAEPQGVKLGDPAFAALPDARAEFGRLGGAVYQIEMPEDWNGKLVLFMHGFEELGPEAKVTAPDIRRFLIGNGYAWGASSFSSTSMIPGRSTDETAALWDMFVRKFRRPARTYVIGQSMGGMAANIAAERYADRFDGSLALCGSAGLTPAVKANADYFTAGAYVAGVTQAEFDTADLSVLIRTRIGPALRDQAARTRFENIVLDITGGPRAFDREGLRIEETTDWRRAEWLVGLKLAPNRDTEYRLGPLSSDSSAEFNRAAIRLSINDVVAGPFLRGNETTGALRMPLLTMHTTGDGQVPIDQAQILQQRVDAAGKGNLLVQRVVRDPSHCGFTTREVEAGFEALVAWVEKGTQPSGTNVMVDDLRHLDHTFELSPRAGTPGSDAVPGRNDRVTFRGNLTLDGAPLDAQFLGAVVRRNGLITPCQVSLPSVVQGHYSIPVFADAESTGCGGPGAEVLLWTFANDKTMYTSVAAPWPGNSRSQTFDANFSAASPDGAVPPTAQYSGDAFSADGERLAPGTEVEAYVGSTLCGVASTRRTGNFSGYILGVVGPKAIAACTAGAPIRFRVNGQPATETGVNTPTARGTELDLTLE